MKKILRHLVLVLFAIGSFSLCSAQIRVEVPVSHEKNQNEIYNQGSTITNTQTNEETGSVWIKILQIANEYLRVGLVVTLLAVVVITGARLMAGKHEDNGTALMNALVALLIAIFSYTIIKILINLF